MTRRVALPVLLLLGAASPLPAQEGSLLDRLGIPGARSDTATPETVATPQDSGEDRQAADAEPRAIPIEQIPRRLALDAERLRAASAVLDRDVREEGSERGVVEGLASADAILDNLDSLSLDRLTRATLRDFHGVLERERLRLERDAGALATRFEELETLRRRLEREREEWRLTRADLVADSLLPAEALAGIDRLTASMDALAERLRRRTGELLELEEEISLAEARLDAALGRLGRAETRLRRRLLVRNAPPVWALREFGAAGKPLVGDVALFAERDIRAFRESLDADRSRVALHLLVFLAALALLQLLRARVREWPEEEATDAARFVLGRPWAAAFLIAVLATGWVYPHASLLVFELAFLLAAFAVVRLLPREMPGAARRGVYALVLLTAIVRGVNALLPPEGLVRRATLLGAAVTGLVLFLSFRAGLRTRTSVGSGGAREIALLRAAEVAVLLLAASALLNAAGWADLGGLLVTGTFTSAWLAVLLALAAVVVEGIVRGILVGPVARRWGTVFENRARISRVLVGAILLVAALVWARGTLAAFGLERAVLGAVADVLSHRFSIGAVQLSIGRILLFAFLIWLAVKAGRVARTLLRDELLPRLSLSPGQADAYATLAHWAILIAGILFAAASAGLGGSQLAVVAGALSVGIGFGLQNIVNNFVSGFILIFEQPIKAGDKVELRGINLYGEVKRIGIRSSTIRTFDGADVIVPNSNVIQSEVVNWTLTDPTRRIEVDVGLAYGTPPDRVVALLVATARATPGVLPEPEPFALFMGFGDSSLNFRLLAWAATFDEFVRLRSTLAIAVERAVREAGFEIPFPQRDLHLRSVDGRAAASLREGEERGHEPDGRDPVPNGKGPG